MALVDPGTFFKRTIFSYSHDASIGAVANGTVDGAAVDSIVFDWEVAGKPELKSALRVIHTSAPLPFAPIVTPASLPSRTRDLIATALLAMPDSEDGRMVLRKLQIDGFRAPDPDSYDLVIAIHDRVGRHLRTR